MDASFIIYTGPATTYIPITPGQDLETILQNIDAAINSHSSAPDYSGYNLYCVKQVDGITHPTNTQNFAEGISKNLCDFHTAYNTFTGTTYTGAIATLTSGVSGLQDPALTYVPFSIVNTDNIQQVWAKMFTGINGMLATANPSGASWSTIGVASGPTNVTAAFDDIITYISALSTTVGTKQASLGTFDNSGNCLSGTNADTPTATINLLRAYVCTLPTFLPGGLTWGCVTPEGNLTDTIQSILTTLNAVDAGYVSTAGTGLTTGAGACGGKTISVDTTWSGLYKCAVSAGDIATAGYLADKFTSLDGSVVIDTSTHPTKVDLSVPIVGDYKTKTTSGTTAGYLQDLIPSVVGDWGLSIAASVVGNQLILTPTVVSPGVFIQNFITRISDDQELLAQFCALVAQCSGCQCAAPTGLSVVVTTA